MASDITRVLAAIQRGDQQAGESLLPLVYEELRRLAASRMANEPADHTLQPTALVHEVWLRLGAGNHPAWQTRAHFFGAAAEAMRRILIENARRKKAVRHGGGRQKLNIDQLEAAEPGSADHLLAIHDALEKLQKVDERKAELVKLRYFVGLSFEEAAELLSISVPTAKRWWAYSRAWLYDAIKSQAQ